MKQTYKPYTLVEPTVTRPIKRPLSCTKPREPNMYCYTIIQCKIELYVFILFKYTSVFMLHAGQLSTLVKCTSRLEGNTSVFMLRVGQLD